MRLILKLGLLSLAFAGLLFCQCPQGYVSSGGQCISTSVVNGAANLTTAGAIPYVRSPYTLNQDASNLFWDATNHRLGIGNVAPRRPIEVTGNAWVSGDLAANTLSSTTSNTAEWALGSYYNGLNLGSGTYVGWGSSNASTKDVALFRANAGILELNNGTPGTLAQWNAGSTDLQRSNASYTLRVYDQTATTGTTKALVRAGAADTVASKMMSWQSNAGTDVLWVDGLGGLHDAALKATTSAFSKSNTTVADVTGLSWALKSGVTYSIEGGGQITQTAAGGQKLKLAYSAGVTSGQASFTSIDSAGLFALSAVGVINTEYGGTTANTNTAARVIGSITPSADGTLTLQFGQNAASGTSTIEPGFFLSVRPQ